MDGGLAFLAHLWGDNERQAEARPRKSNAGTYVGRTMGDSGSYHPNTGKREDYGRQAEARPREGGRTIQHRHTCGEKKESREGGHTTQHTCGAHMREDNGKQGGTREDRPREGRRTIQQRKIRRETRLQKRGHTIQDREIRRDTKGGKTGGTRRQHPTQGDKAGQDLGKAGAAATGTHGGDMGDKLGDQARQELGNVDAPSNTGSPLSWDGVSAFPRSCLPLCLPSCFPLLDGMPAFPFCLPLFPMSPTASNCLSLSPDM